MRLQDLPLDCVGKVLIHWPRPTFPHACRGLCRAFAMATRDVVLISAPSKIFWHELCLHAYFLAASWARQPLSAASRESTFVPTAACGTGARGHQQLRGCIRRPVLGGVS